VTKLVEAEHTKSEASAADMYIVPETREYLLSLKRRQSENRLLCGGPFNANDHALDGSSNTNDHVHGGAFNANDHVCVWPDGSDFKPDYVSRGFKDILIKNKLPIIRFHELRHTAGSQLLKNGATMKQVQKYLRHGSMQSTMVYLHGNDDEDKKEMSLVMGDLLGKSRL